MAFQNLQFLEESTKILFTAEHIEAYCLTYSDMITPRESTNSIAANMRHHLCREKPRLPYTSNSDCLKIIDREVKGIVWICTSGYCGPE